MRSLKTREKCTGRLRMLFDFLDIRRDSIVEHSEAFCDRAKYDNRWAFNSIVQYLRKQKKRIEREKENKRWNNEDYFQAINLFCDMTDIPIPWKKISRGIPRSRKLQTIERTYIRRNPENN